MSSLADPREAIAQAVALSRNRHHAAALALFERLVADKKLDAYGLRAYAAALAAANDLAKAALVAESALANDETDAPTWLLLAGIRQDAGQLPEALAAVDAALRHGGDLPEAHNNRGTILVAMGKVDEAASAFRRACQLRPDYLRAHKNLCTALLELNEADHALEEAESMLRGYPDHGDAHRLRGRALENLSRWQEAEESYRHALRLTPQDPSMVATLANFLEARQQPDASRVILEAALSNHSQNHQLWFLHGRACELMDDMAHAANSYERSRQLKPDALEPVWRSALMLPSVYADRKQLMLFRARFESGLGFLEGIVTDESIENARTSAIPSTPPSFLLAYQGENDLELQTRQGNLVAKVMRGLISTHESTSTPSLVVGRRIRVGFCGRRFYRCTAGQYFESWITDLDPARFETFVYSARPGGDDLTGRIRTKAAHFFESSASVATLAARIAGDHLDVLIYPELGMDPPIYQTAALHLAPRQLCAWGHPVTSGLPTIDGFLSCADMEPPDAPKHYRERLHLLPGLGTRYVEPAIDSASAAMTRADFQLPEEATLILFPQSLFKIHPDNDDLLVSILRDNPATVIVMFAGQNAAITRRFTARLRMAFARQKVAENGRIRMLPALPHAQFLQVNRLCEFMFDTLHWSGGNTTLDALASDLPVVTLPGRFMRGRQSASMLRMIGLNELIANDTRDMGLIAARLASDREWRASLKAQIRLRRTALFNDERPVRALESLLETMCVGDSHPNTLL